MEELFKIGIDLQNIKYMLEVNPLMAYLEDYEIQEKVEILKNLDCSSSIIKNVIEANPLYLSRSNDDIEKLFAKLKSLGIKRLDITIDSNPWILNYDDYDIDEFIVKKRKEGLELVDVIDLIDAGMVDFN